MMNDNHYDTTFGLDDEKNNLGEQVIYSNEFYIVREWSWCWKNSMKWIRNWLLVCPLEHDIEVVRILKFHIGNDNKKLLVYMLMGLTLGWALGVCELGPLVQIIIIFY